MSDGPRTPVRGRYAPSPTGLTHLGNARTALLAWLSVRSRAGRFVWRLEDIDHPRTVAGMAEAALEDLAWLGLDWDEGGAAGGPHAPYDQSRCGAFYEEALERLAALDATFPCALSRRDLAELASAPTARPESPCPPYPPHLRPAGVTSGWYERLRDMPTPDAAIRFKVPAGTVAFGDLLCGRCEQDVAAEVGDFVLKRRDGLYAYQLAVVVDDLRMGVDEVVRGRDLLDSTARQILLFRKLGNRVPTFAHVPLLVNADGEKLSKRDAALSLRSLRKAGIAPEQAVGWLAASCGLIEQARAVTAGELVAGFDWSRVGGGDDVVPHDVVRRIRMLR